MRGHFFAIFFLISSAFSSILIPIASPAASCDDLMLSNIEHLRKALARKGAARELLGYHGTSVEALKLALATGRMPDAGGSRGFFSVIPRLAALPKSYREALRWKEDPQPLLEIAKDYAEDVAGVHFLLERLELRNLSLQAMRTFLSIKMDVDHLLPFVRNHGGKTLDQTEFHSLLLESKKRAGVILGISKRVLKELDWNPNGDYIDLLTGEKGLPLKSIVTIKPLSPADKAALEEILKEYP